MTTDEAVAKLNAITPNVNGAGWTITMLATAKFSYEVEVWMASGAEVTRGFGMTIAEAVAAVVPEEA